MPWKELEAPDIPDTLLSEAKAQARVTTSSEDSLIDLYVAAAVRRIEKETRRAIVSREFLLALDDFPCSDEIVIPVGQLSAVESVEYLDGDGVLTEWADTNYTVGTVGPRGRIVKGLGVTWPFVQSSVAEAVQITFTAGYGTDEADIPEELRLCILFLAAHWYNTREPINVGNIVTPLPLTFDYALDPYRIFVP